MEAFEIALVALATFAGATLQSATGFGYALLAGPATFAVFEPAEAIMTLICLSTVLNVLTLVTEGREPAVRRREIGRVLAWAVPGVVAGVLILTAISKPALQVIVGIAVLVAVGVQVKANRGKGNTASASAQAIAGFAAGTLTTTTGTSGPPLVLLLDRAGASPEEFRDTIAALFLGLNVLGAIALVAAEGSAELPEVATLALLGVILVLGHLLGRLIFARLDASTFRAVGLVLIVIAGLASIAAGLVAG
ncbi:MAG TPA: sulfite exporter TauE/SafE family protein [Solirubrobacterales bacterium]|nr:sulfite exporter TauE/SafE family protein [Solirubrobacterales bacterium]